MILRNLLNPIHLNGTNSVLLILLITFVQFTIFTKSCGENSTRGGGEIPSPPNLIGLIFTLQTYKATSSIRAKYIYTKLSIFYFNCEQHKSFRVL